MKKFFGIVLIIIGSILSLATLLASLPLIIKSLLSVLHNPNATSIGEFIGSIIGFLLLMGIALFLIIKGPVEEY
jgi:Ca2+/Na+ antiporter